LGMAYRICIQPYFNTPGSCFYDYALGGTKDISSIAPTLPTGPINYSGAQGPPIPFLGLWSSSTVYTLGQAVSFANAVYISLTNPNLNNNPSTSTANWSVVLQPASLLSLPGATQTVILPTGTTFAVNSLNGVLNASLFAGADIGAKVNAANIAAGATAADIWVTVTGTVSTVPTIHSNHRLILAAPLVWNVGPVLNSNTQLLGTGASAVQTVNTNTGWISASNLSNITINNLWFTNTFASAGIQSQIFHCQTCNGIYMRNNHLLGIGLVFSDSTASASYAAVNDSNLSQNVIISDNFMDGQTNQVALALYFFTKNVISSNNVAMNALENVEWWGGNAATDGVTLTNPRWAININITGGSAINVRAGFWGGMGQNITVTGVTVDTCSDVCLDAESSTNVAFSGFTVHNATNGGLATFFAAQHIEFGPGIVTSDTSASSLLFAHNSSFLETLSVDIKVHNVKFLCADTATLCLMASDPIGGFQFNDNEVENATLTFTGPNNSGYEIARNHFSYTFAPGSSFNAIGIPGQENKYKPNSSIKGNTFQSSVTQPAGTFAINATITDFNFNDILYVSYNITQGFTNDAKFVAASLNAGITPTFIFTNNAWGSNSVTSHLRAAEFA
jgi:hypothetical protein